jgi:hypothetical protein
MGATNNKPDKGSRISFKEFTCMKFDRDSIKSEESEGLECNILEDIQASNASKKWPNGVIHYRIDESLISHPALISSIEEAISQYHKETPIKLIEIQRNQDVQDWVLFTFHQNLITSYVGRLGGMQEIYLSPKAIKGNVMHEIMHALGFLHEHSRVDRDKYVNVETESSNRELIRNYLIEGCPLGEYDLDSIMHYHIDGKILKAKKKDPDKRIGQRERFSDGDIRAIKYLYSDPCCTYDAFGEEYFVQSYHECITCWGEESAYGVCEYCKDKCHQDHELKFHHYTEVADHKVIFVCDCGRNRHRLDVCTRSTTGERRVNRVFYMCKDCFEVEDYRRENRGNTPVVCKTCLGKCHEGHQVEEYGLAPGFCDCGKRCCKIICKAR